MAESTESLAVSTCENPLYHPKCVILRHCAKDYDPWDLKDYYDTVRVYLTASGRSLDELDQEIHYSHLQPPEAAVRGCCYIIIDLHKDLLKNPGLKQVQHDFTAFTGLRTVQFQSAGFGTQLKSRTFYER
ncbi:hypothetical protein BDV41DRAFT_521286 [Aspergillus transmontanensis]|uniref:Uncharacterized protein n=1 Tax=Aspergillus transmontanensis TaxID=1034304 RepID=A0A5N6WEB4_9EURO|nr:hypothetical protein BDV41DRAFT_521286 [Aspergillus transmontanensis]